MPRLLPLSLIALAAACAPGLAAPIAELVPRITETDEPVLHPVGTISVPAAGEPQAWDWMLWGRHFQAGLDYGRPRGTITLAAGQAAEIPLQLELVGDVRSEQDGEARVVFKPAGATWADAYPALVPIPGMEGVRRILSWKDGLVWLSRQVAGTYHLQSWRRTDSGVELVASIPPPQNDRFLFAQVVTGPSFGFFSGPVAFFRGTVPRTFALDASAPNGWRQWTTPADAFSLHDGQLYGNYVRRWDITNPTRWSPSGFHYPPIIGKGDTLFSYLGVGKRVPGSDNLWNWTGVDMLNQGEIQSLAIEENVIASLTAAPTPSVVVATLTEAGWHVTTLPTPQAWSSTFSRTDQLALQDGLLAVGRPLVEGTETGRIEFFLRDDKNPTAWNPAGSLSRSDPFFGGGVFLDGRDLIVQGGTPEQPVYYWSSLPGKALHVLDDDRTRVTVHDRTLREPAETDEPLEIEVTLPREARDPVTVHYTVESGTAENGSDFTGASGSLTIPAGAWRGVIPVVVRADRDAEPDERFHVRVLGVTGGLPPLHETTITVRDSDDRQIVRVERSPVLEGFPPASINLRLDPPGAAAAAPVTLEVTARGFPEESTLLDSLPLATLSTDIETRQATLALTPNQPHASLTLEAPQDAIKEPASEEISFTWKATNGAVLAPEFSPTAVLPPHDPLARFVVSADWVFSMTTTDREIWKIDAYQRGEAFGSWPFRQRLTVTQITGEPGLDTDGKTLAITLVRNERPKIRLILFRLTDEATALWQPAVDLNFEPPFGGNRIVPTLQGDCLRLGNVLLERVCGDRDWRFTSDFTDAPLISDEVGPFEFDGDEIALTDANGATIRLFRRAWTGSQKWTPKDSFPVPEALRGSVVSVANGRLLLLPYFDKNGSIFARTTAGWVEELITPPSARLLSFDGQLLVTQDQSFTRSGQGAGSWSPVPPPSPVVLPPSTPRSIPLLLRDGVQLRMSTGYGATHFHLWEPGARVFVADDDSLELNWNRVVFASEKAGEESVGSYRLTANRLVPVPIGVRVRTVSGTALAGEDFVPVERDVWLYPPGLEINGSDLLHVPILPDRKLEGEETFLLESSLPTFGAPMIPSPTTIYEPPLPSGTSLAVTLREPAEGEFTYFALIPLPTGTDIPAVVPVTRQDSGGSSDTRATTGGDFTFPDRVAVPVGATAITIPITVKADALIEKSEHALINGVPIVILDRTASSLTPGKYTAPQNGRLTANGLAGNPPGLTSLGGPSGERVLGFVPEGTAIRMDPSGDFIVDPPPNFLGDILFDYTVGQVREWLGDGAVWRYLHPLDGVDPATVLPSFASEWKTGGASSLPWDTGSGAISYGGFGGLTGPSLGVPPSGQRYTAYFHTTFEVPAAGTQPLQLRIAYDDAVIVSINGIERGRQGVMSGPAFATAAESYTLLSGGSGAGFDPDEALVRSIDLGQVPLNAGTNHMAVSLHNSTTSSSDLGLKLERLINPILAGPTTVRVTVVDSRQPPLVRADAYAVSQARTFQTGDDGTRGLFDNDGLLKPDGTAHDPVLELITTQPHAGTLELIGLTGQFQYTPPRDFIGETRFSYQVRDKDGFSEPAEVTLNITPGLPFDVWRQAAFPAQAGLSLAADSDTDGDGLDLFQEFALFAHPAAPDTGTIMELPASGLSPVFKTRVRLAADLATTLERSDSLSGGQWSAVVELRGFYYRQVDPYESSTLESTAADELSISIPARPDRPRQYYRLRTQRLLF